MSDRMLFVPLIIGGILTLLIGWAEEDKAAIAGGAMLYGLGFGVALMSPRAELRERSK